MEIDRLVEQIGKWEDQPGQAIDEGRNKFNYTIEKSGFNSK